MNDPVKNLEMAIGSLGEMVHMFYKSMRNAGASKGEALECTGSFIYAFVSTVFDSNRGGVDD